MIPLTSTLCKLLERVISTRLRWFLESQNLLNQHQAGFRKGRGCTDHIVRLTQDIAANSNKKRKTLAVFLDLEKAFDMVWREGIIDQLSEMGVKGRPLQWIFSFLQDRSIQVRIGSALSRPFLLENGTPQGSVLSPLLFIIMLNAIPNPKKGVELSMYADDIALWTTGTNIDAMTKSMQKQLNETAKFLNSNGFKISALKSQAVLFSKSRTKSSEVSVKLHIDEQEISLSPTATFLGITMDARLNWNAHSLDIKNRCMKRLNAMRAISGSSWGANKTSLLHVYRATIRSLLDYGCAAIDLGNNLIKDVYNKIQYQALKICCGGMKGTSATSLQVECGELPLDLRRQKLIANHAIRSIASNNKTLENRFFIQNSRKSKTQARLHILMKKKGLASPVEKIESLIPRDLISDIAGEVSATPRWRLKKPVIDTSNLSIAADNPLRMLVAREKIEDLSLQGNLLCYTDASKTTDNKAGIGIYIPQKKVNISLRTSSHSCISSTELAAIEDCLLHVKDSYQGEIFNIVILSDSLSALQSLENCDNSDRDVNRTLSLISDIQETGRKVTLVWVPAHVGIPGNEKADELAKAATSREQIDRRIPASIKDVKRSVACKITQQWQTRWEENPDSRHYKEIEKHVSTTSKFQCVSRRKETLISKLRLGKCALNRYLFLMKHHEDGKCQVCPQEDETVRHFLMDCPAQSVLRMKIQLAANITGMSSMLSNPASVDLIFRWICEKRRQLIYY